MNDFTAKTTAGLLRTFKGAYDHSSRFFFPAHLYIKFHLNQGGFRGDRSGSRPSSRSLDGHGRALRALFFLRFYKYGAILESSALFEAAGPVSGNRITTLQGVPGGLV